jgi:hypothetical protein
MSKILGPINGYIENNNKFPLSAHKRWIISVIPNSIIFHKTKNIPSFRYENKIKINAHHPNRVEYISRKFLKLKSLSLFFNSAIMLLLGNK